MPVLDSWYRVKDWRGTGIVQPPFWDQVSANNRRRSNASTEPVYISVLAWYRCPVPRQYRWTTSSQVTFRSRASGRPCLCQDYASSAPVLQIVLRYCRGTKRVMNFHLGVTEFKAKNTTNTIDQPPYSLDLAPCDFFPFTKQKFPLRGSRFNLIEAIEQNSWKELKVIPESTYKKCFEDWKKRCHMYVASNRAYSEGKK